MNGRVQTVGVSFRAHRGSMSVRAGGSVRSARTVRSPRDVPAFKNNSRLGVSNVPLYAAADIPVLFGYAGRMTHGTETHSHEKVFCHRDGPHAARNKRSRRCDVYRARDRIV